MPASPHLVLVDPRAQHRRAVRERVVSIAVGVALAAVCAIPFALTFLQ